MDVCDAFRPLSNLRPRSFALTGFTATLLCAPNETDQQRMDRSGRHNEFHGRYVRTMRTGTRFSLTDHIALRPKRTKLLSKT